MASEAAKLLDELMGRNRNRAPTENAREPRWEDPEVCKFALCGFCPHDLFVNTRADLGVCEKIHDDELQKCYQKSSRCGRMGYEEDFLRFLQDLLSDVERRIKKGQSRLALNNAQASLSSGPQMAREEKAAMLTEKINDLVQQAEELGCEGNVEQAQGVLKLCEKLKEERAQLENSDIYMLPQPKEMEVCHVCGAFLVANDAQQRVEEHLMGKQHTGYATVRVTVDDLKISQHISLREQSKEMEVCEICGALLVVGDIQQRVNEHIMGKQHIGYARIRATVDDLRQKREKRIHGEDPAEREARLTKEREEYDKLKEERRKKEALEKEEAEKKKKRSRSRSRSKRSRSRDRKKRSRSRDRKRRSRSRDRHSRRGSRDRHRSKRSHRSRSKDRKSKDKESSSRDKESSTSKDKESGSSRDKERSSGDKERSSGDKERSRSSRDRDRSSRDKDRSRSSRDRDRSSRDKDRSKSSKESERDRLSRDKDRSRSSRDRDGRSRDKDRRSRDEDRRSRDKDRSSRDKERSSQDKDRSSRDRDRHSSREKQEKEPSETTENLENAPEPGQEKKEDIQDAVSVESPKEMAQIETTPAAQVEENMEVNESPENNSHNEDVQQAEEQNEEENKPENKQNEDMAEDVAENVTEIIEEED